ncbi:hypothetical protein VOLCADRAFT_104663, partial [Volvox carteri f. nagariensis]
MESELPDFCGLGTADLLGLALDGVQQPQGDGVLQGSHPAAGGVQGGISHPWSEVATGGQPDDVCMPGLTLAHNRARGAGAAAAAIMTTQELDSELCRLPLESEPQPGSEPPQHLPTALGTHISATQSRDIGASKQGDTVRPRILPDTLDSAALDDELRALPLETQDLDAGPGADPNGDAYMNAVTGNELEAIADPAGARVPQSFGSASVVLGDGGVYMDSQALDDALRALPIGSSVEDDLQPPPGAEAAARSQGGGVRGAANRSPVARGQMGAAVPERSVHGESHRLVDPTTEPQPHHRQAPLPQQQQGLEAAPGARPAPSGWEAFGGAASFDDDLEDYLAAQAAEMQQAVMPVPPPPRRQQPPDLDDLDDLIAELEYDKGGPSARSPRSTVAGAAVATAHLTSSQRGTLAMGGLGAGVGGPRQQGVQATVQQGAAGAVRQGGEGSDRDRAAKRPRTEARGRPTMEELFGSDDEEGVEVVTAATAAAPTEKNPLAAGRAAKDVGTVNGHEVVGEEAVRPAGSSYFPPQRLASNIQGGIVLPVTAASGERVYCRVAENAGGATERGSLTRAAARQHGGSPDAGAGRRHGRSCLLGAPLADMLRELEDRQLRAAVAASEREEERRRLRQLQLQLQQHRLEHEVANAEGDLEDEKRAFADLVEQRPVAEAGLGRRGRRVSGAAAHEHLAPGVGFEEARLWVDKYAPRHFMSLLSDERTNRQVALWVKDWDECVFGRGGTSAGVPGSKPGAAAGRKADSRPQQKVLLIGGPPGLGKTTLAHVVARHCGYHPYEINASDDRTAATLLTKIQDAVQMTAVLGGGRPNCVIVDEVDGATGGSETGGAVAALLKLVRAGEGGAAGSGGKGGGKATGGGDDDDDDGSGGENEGADGGKKTVGAGGAKRRGGGRKGSQQRPLCRPIICICNDLYAPALRPLRDIARVFHFSPPVSERLTARLVQICQAEQLEADPAALRLLVERTDRDVRACLNTLQFLARRGEKAGAGGGAAGGRRTIDIKDIESLNIASKDTTQSAMDMWTLLLSTSAAGRRRGGGAGGMAPGSAAGRLTELCNRLQDFGDYDLVLNGLHENLPRVRFMDINLSRTAEVEATIGLADVLLRSCRRTGDFSSLRFVPPLLANVRALAAQPERPRQLAWPRLGAEVARRASATSQLVRSWASNRGTDPLVAASHGITVMMLELAPALRALVSRPPIRAVAPNMMTADEQAALRRTADIMLHYGLRYCFESPTPPGPQPLQLPEAVAPVSSNAIILGLTAEVQQNIAAAAAAGTRTAGGFQRQAPQPYGGRGSGGVFQSGRGGRGSYNSYGQGRGPAGDARFRVQPGAGGRGAATNGQGTPMQPTQGAAPPAPSRRVPLVPAIDTLHVFTAFAGAAAAGERVTVPHVVRRIIAQQTEMEAIRRAEAARMVVPVGGSSSQPTASQPTANPMRPEGPGAGHAIGPRGNGPLQPVAPPQPQRQMAGRMPPPADGKKGQVAGGGAGVKRKGTWMDAFKQQASAKARCGGASGVSAGAAARNTEEAAKTTEGAGCGIAGRAESPKGGPTAGAQGKLPFPVLYRFNEGYTNAV